MFLLLIPVSKNPLKLAAGSSGRSHADTEIQPDVDGSDERFWWNAHESIAHVAFVVVVEDGTICVIPSVCDECRVRSVVGKAKDSTTLSMTIWLVVKYV